MVFQRFISHSDLGDEYQRTKIKIYQSKTDLLKQLPVWGALMSPKRWRPFASTFQKMAESAPLRELSIISWQAHINNKVHNAKCECSCLREDAQQVHPSFPFCSTKSLPVRTTSVWKLCLIILLCATSQNAQRSRDLVIIGSSGHRERSETLVRVDTSVPGPGEMAQCTTHQLQDTARPSAPPCRRLMVVRLVRALCSCLGPNSCHGKSIRGRTHTRWAVDW